MHNYGSRAADNVKRSDVGALCGLHLRRGNKINFELHHLHRPNLCVGCARTRARAKMRIRCARAGGLAGNQNACVNRLMHHVPLM